MDSAKRKVKVTNTDQIYSVKKVRACKDRNQSGRKDQFRRIELRPERLDKWYLPNRFLSSNRIAKSMVTQKDYQDLVYERQINLSNLVPF